MKNSHFHYIVSPLMLALMLICGPTIKALAQDAANAAPEGLEHVQQYCPPADSLTQDPHTKAWTAPGGWKSLNPSFFRTVEQFVGAQWIGVNVGNVICSYAKANKPEFPIHLQRETLVAIPNGGTWGEDKGGYKDCHSANIEQCPFSVIVPEKSKNIYEDIDYYKQTAP